MFKIVLLGFLVFTVSVVLVPTQTYAISLDDEEEDAEDVEDLLDEAKKAGKSESFSKANELLEKAKMYSTGSLDVGEAEQYVSAKKQARDARLERERKERERLARLKREKAERERQARLEAQRQQSSNYSVDTRYTLTHHSTDDGVHYTFTGYCLNGNGTFQGNHTPSIRSAYACGRNGCVSGTTKNEVIHYVCR